MPRPTSPPALCVWMLLGLVGCDGVAPLVDAGAADAGTSVPESPVSPAAPTFAASPCPSGWRDLALGEGRACEPWESVPTCAPGELLSPGAGCVPLADDCATDVPQELDDTFALVVPGAAAGGDGSLARPFATIGAATRAGHARIALAPGDHILEAGSHDDLTLVGTCPNSTFVRIPTFATLRGTSAIRRLTFNHGQISVPRGATLTVDAVELTGMDRAFEVSGTLTARRVAIRDGLELGVLGLNPDAITLEDVSFERMPSGIYVGPPTTEPDYEPHATVRLTRVAATEIADIAIQAEKLTSLELDEVVVEGAVAGVLTDVSAFAMVDSFLRELSRTGVGAIGAGTKRIERTSIANGGEAAVLLEGGSFTLEDLAVDGSRLALSIESADGSAGRIVARDSRTYAIEVLGGTVSFTDVVVDGVVATSDDTGSALVVSTGATVTVERARFTRTQHVAAGATAATLRMSDLTIDAVEPIAEEDGCGLLALEAATLEVDRARIEHVAGMGARIEGSSARLTDVVIAEVAASVGEFGVGVLGASSLGGLLPVSLTLSRVRIEETRRAGVAVFGPAATLDASDLVVERSLASTDSGVALAVLDGTVARGERFRLAGSELAGLLLTDDVDVELTHGRIESNPFGLLAPTLDFNTGGRPGYRLHDVAFVSNEIDYQASSLMLELPAPIAF
ncbi:MAG: hypothetical protein AB7S26_41740 [Sandaracinaceae bacterium]